MIKTILAQPEQTLCLTKTQECKSVKSNYLNDLYDLYNKNTRRGNIDNAYCIGFAIDLCKKIDTIVSHVETWASANGQPRHILTSVEMIADFRSFLEVGIYQRFIDFMQQPQQPQQPQPQRPWVGLTDAERDDLVMQHAGYGRNNLFAVARAVEIKLKEKNT